MTRMLAIPKHPDSPESATITYLIDANLPLFDLLILRSLTSWYGFAKTALLLARKSYILYLPCLQTLFTWSASRKSMSRHGQSNNSCRLR